MEHRAWNSPNRIEAQDSILVLKSPAWPPASVRMTQAGAKQEDSRLFSSPLNSPSSLGDQYFYSILVLKSPAWSPASARMAEAGDQVVDFKTRTE